MKFILSLFCLCVSLCPQVFPTGYETKAGNEETTILWYNYRVGTVIEKFPITRIDSISFRPSFRTAFLRWPYLGYGGKVKIEVSYDTIGPNEMQFWYAHNYVTKRITLDQTVNFPDIYSKYSFGGVDAIEPEKWEYCYPFEFPIQIPKKTNVCITVEFGPTLSPIRLDSKRISYSIKYPHDNVGPTSVITRTVGCWAQSDKTHLRFDFTKNQFELFTDPTVIFPISSGASLLVSTSLPRMPTKFIMPPDCYSFIDFNDFISIPVPFDTPHSIPIPYNKSFEGIPLITQRIHTNQQKVNYFGTTRITVFPRIFYRTGMNSRSLSEIPDLDRWWSFIMKVN